MREVVASFNAAFKEANKTRKRYKVLTGSAGSGKSYNVAMDYIIKLSDMRYEGANLLVVRATESSHSTSTYSELVAAIYRLGLQDFWDMPKSNLTLTCHITGSQIIFKGFNDQKAKEKIKSINFKHGKLTWIWCEEATELDFTDLQYLDDRLRGHLPKHLFYQITLTFNPVSAMHWIKTQYWDRDDEDIFKLRTTYLDNKYIDEAYHRRMERRKEMDPEGYRVYGLGEWGELGGLILNNYKVKDIPLAYEYYDSVVLGQDFGFNHANVILTVGFKDGDIYILDELYEHEKDTEELITMARRQGLSKSNVMWCDSAEPDRIKMWRKAGYRAQPVSKDKNSVAAQIDYLKQHNIFINPSCQNTIKEIQQWKWQKDNKTGQYIDKPVEVNDDAMAALRYAIEPLRRNNKLKTMSKQGLGL